jgi:hypothetical protein
MSAIWYHIVEGIGRALQSNFDGHWVGIGGHWWALVGIESDIVSMDVKARIKVGPGIVEETYGKEERRTKLVHKSRCTKRPKKRGSRTLYNIKREKKGPVAYVLRIF